MAIALAIYVEGVNKSIPSMFYSNTGTACSNFIEIGGSVFYVFTREVPFAINFKVSRFRFLQVDNLKSGIRILIFLASNNNKK